jgi:hypothetical protein
VIIDGLQSLGNEMPDVEVIAGIIVYFPMPVKNILVKSFLAPAAHRADTIVSTCVCTADVIDDHPSKLFAATGVDGAL